MLLYQFMVWSLAAVKRFDSLVLHAWSSARELSRRGFGSDGEADLG
jgi:hypothetical protein